MKLDNHQAKNIASTNTLIAKSAKSSNTAPQSRFQSQKSLFRSLCIASILVGSGYALADTQNEVASTDTISPVERHTLKDLRDKNIIKQQLDYSCGAAAMATLMVGYFGETTTEKDLLDLLNVRLSAMTKEEQSRKQRNGFSLLDLKLVAQKKGYKAAGFKLTVEQLRQLAAPVIVFVLPMGYHHFAVLRGIVDDHVYLADPGRGNLRMSIPRFEDEYGGIIFVLGKGGEENILEYPLQVGRKDDYAKPETRNVFYRANYFTRTAVEFASRSHFP